MDWIVCYCSVNRTHRMHRMQWLIVLDVTRSVVCMSVCRSHGFTVLCKNGWTDRDAVWGADSCG